MVQCDGENTTVTASPINLGFGLHALLFLLDLVDLEEALARPFFFDLVGLPPAIRDRLGFFGLSLSNDKVNSVIW